jgi:hypothetical protein
MMTSYNITDERHKCFLAQDIQDQEKIQKDVSQVVRARHHERTGVIGIARMTFKGGELLNG